MKNGEQKQTKPQTEYKQTTNRSRPVLRGNLSLSSLHPLKDLLRSHDGKPLQLLSAVTHHLRLTLDQVAIEEKSNEIPALKPLLKKLVWHAWPSAPRRSACAAVGTVERYFQKHHQPKESALLEIGCYATSLAFDERNDQQLMRAIRGHWSASQNGTHYRRDLTLGEDACRTAARQAAALLASLRNLANGIYELQKEQKRTTVDTLKSRCQQQTFTTVWPIGHVQRFGSVLALPPAAGIIYNLHGIVWFGPSMAGLVERVGLVRYERERAVGIAGRNGAFGR